MKLKIIVLSCSLLIGCGASSIQYTGAEWQSRKSSKEGRRATIYVGSVDIDCVVDRVMEDRILISQGTLKSEIAHEVISKIEFLGTDGKTMKIVAGAAAGLAVGGTVGYFVGKSFEGDKRTDEGKKIDQPIPFLHPVAIIAIVGGGVGGGMFGSSFSQREDYTLNGSAVSYSLSPELGSEITPLELKSYNLFEDLALNSDEKILQVQIFKLKNGKYFLLYDESYWGVYRTGGKIVEESYIVKQASNLKKK